MLQSQVNFWTLEENKRSHLAQEAIQWFQNTETKRHNLAMEGFESQGLKETGRHNLQTELINSFANDLRSRELEETKWRNRKNVKQTQTSLKQENKRIRETRRHNKATEALSAESNAIGFSNVSLGYSQLSETARSHRANEQIDTYQSVTSRASQQESARHNKETESQQRFQNTVSFGSSSASQSQALTREKEYSWAKDKFNITWPYEKARSISDTVNSYVSAAARASDAINSWVGKSKGKS